MPTDSAEFHEEAAAEYDAAFDWYRERSPDAAVKFDAEMDRALAHIIESPRRWAIGPHLRPAIMRRRKVVAERCQQIDEMYAQAEVAGPVTTTE
jgi:plasmid stabilization system protein ParE